MGFLSGHRRYAIAGLLVVGAIGVGAAAVENLSARDANLGPDSASSSMEPVAVELKNSQQRITKLSIPRAYIPIVSEPNKELQSIIVVVYLPDYLPRFAAEQAGHRTLGKSINGIHLRSPDEIAIYVKSSTRDLQAKMINSAKGHTIYGGEYRPGVGIYYRRTFQAGSTEPTPDKFSGYLIPADRDDFYLQFTASPKTGKMVGCSLHFNLNDDVGIQALFPAEHLDEYEQIRKAVSELVNRFLILSLIHISEPTRPY